MDKQYCTSCGKELHYMYDIGSICTPCADWEEYRDIIREGLGLGNV